MPIYKMIFRDGDNPSTSSLHVYDAYCEALNKDAASAIFEANHGVKYVVAGPMKIEPGNVPEGTVFETLKS